VLGPLYRPLTQLALPFWYWESARRCQRARHAGFFAPCGQQLGRNWPALPSGGVWIHSVSLGESRAALGLARALRQQHGSDLPLAWTTTTETGAEFVRSVLMRLPGTAAAVHAYAPFDHPGAVARVFARLQPRLLVVLETEIWPNWLEQAQQQGVPVALVNARLSARSARRYGRLAPRLIRRSLGRFAWIGAQADADAERLLALGADPQRLTVTGNLKYDWTPEPELFAQAEQLRRASGARPAWVAGSTHAGEEEAAIAAHRTVRQVHPSALLWLVPRHPQRFDAVAALLAASGLPFSRYSAGPEGWARSAVILVDAMGVLNACYAAAQVAFVGGSLASIGGHNLLEPAVLGRAVLSGPNLWHFQDIAAQLRSHQALRQIDDDAELGCVVAELLHDHVWHAPGQRARASVIAGAGAVWRTWAALEPYLHVDRRDEALSGNKAKQ